MLALRDYGSSDESETENEKNLENIESEVKCGEDANIDVISKSFSVEKLTTPINLQICSAPEVVPTVSINVHLIFMSKKYYILRLYKFVVLNIYHLTVNNFYIYNKREKKIHKKICMIKSNIILKYIEPYFYTCSNLILRSEINLIFILSKYLNLRLVYNLIFVDE